MNQMFLYMSIMIVCYLFASKLIKNKERYGFVSKLSTAALYLLIFTMGLRIGANEEVIRDLSAIGVQALITTVMAIGGSILFAFFARKLMGLNRKGLKKDSKLVSSEENAVESGSGLKSSAITLGVAALGMAAGYLVIPVLFRNLEFFQSTAGEAINIFLCLLLGTVGFDLGIEGGIVEKFKAIGLRALVLPIAVIIGTFSTGIIYGLLSPYSMKESVAVFAGMGWYSFAPVVIMEAGYYSASAVSFLHNIFREVFSLMFIPLIAEKIGYYESLAMPASPGMDCCLPTVKKSTNGEMVIYSLISGIILSFLVPFWMPLIIS